MRGDGDARVRLEGASRKGEKTVTLTLKYHRYFRARIHCFLFVRAPGTSTFDGAAIATAVLAYLSHSVRCITLFSTHYHNLVEEFTQDSDVALRHMACIVDPGATASSRPHLHTHTHARFCAYIPPHLLITLCFVLCVTTSIPAHIHST